MLDLQRLENAKDYGHKIIARCPACAAGGGDRKGAHLSVLMPSHRYSCAANQGDKAHNQQIYALVGMKKDTQKTAPGARPWPQLMRGTARGFRELARLRGLDEAAIDLSQRLGLLRFCIHTDRDGIDHRAWVVTDDARLVMRMRRLDGKEWWPGTKTQSRVKRTGAGHNNHLLGVPHLLGKYRDVALVEGEGDLLAAVHCLNREGKLGRCGVVAALGAGVNIAREEARLFKGRSVYIFAHADKAGQEALERWGRTLHKHGASAYEWKLDGLDLNDYTRNHPEREVMPGE